MTVPNKNKVIAEAKKLRFKLELYKNSNIGLITEDFPVMNCKLSSLLFTYHALKNGHKLSSMASAEVPSTTTGMKQYPTTGLSIKKQQ